MICEDGNYHEVGRFDAGTVDFPFDSFVMWFIDNVIMLPSEY